MNNSNIDKSELMQSWGGTLQSLDRLTSSITSCCMENAAACLNENISKYVSDENRLTKYDEKIFDYYKHLMWHYYQTINTYRLTRIKIHDKQIRDILDGICTVLSSQLKQFEESQESEYTGDKSINPIRIEKESLIQEIKKTLNQNLKSTKERFIKEQTIKMRTLLLPLPLSDLNEFEAEAFDIIYNFLTENEFDELYKSFSQAHKDCAEKMNNLQIRKATHFYFESIKQEKENLSLIIKIQVVALEKVMRTKNIPPDEQQAVQSILGTLREGYQYLGKEIEELMDSFRDAEIVGRTVPTMSNEQFSSHLTEIKAGCLASSETLEEIRLSSVYLAEAYGTFIEHYSAGVASVIENTLKRYTASKSMYEYRKMIVEKNMFTDEIIECFNDVVEYFSVFSESLEETENFDILKGIDETMQIKIESLCEGRNEFMESANKLLQQAASEGTGLSDEEMANVRQKMFSKWFDIMTNVNLPLDERFFSLLVDKILSYVDTIDEIALYKERMSKNIEISNGAIDKKILQYLKVHLLFEINTFEEIINYSISRLRDSSIQAIKDYVTHIDIVSKDIVGILKKYNIEQIVPVVGEIFNGKEQEVMMAEKHNIYKKGQIIKVMNSGYKMDGLILIRANIIAAK